MFYNIEYGRITQNFLVGYYMIIKNAMEDIVINAVIELYKDYDEKLLKCGAYIEDVVCYVLNRVPPKYITSGRGVLHFELEKEDNTQQLADIYSLINEARDIICKRRQDKTHLFEEDDFFFKDNVIHTKEYYLNFPYFTGRIITSDKNISDDETSILLSIEINGKWQKAEMLSQNWQNPFIAGKHTYGYYTFWVNPIKAAQQKSTVEEKISFKLNFSNKNYEPIERVVELKIVPERAKYLTVRAGYAVRLDDTVIDLYP